MELMKSNLHLSERLGSLEPGSGDGGHCSDVNPFIESLKRQGQDRRSYGSILYRYRGKGVHGQPGLEHRFRETGAQTGTETFG